MEPPHKKFTQTSDFGESDTAASNTPATVFTNAVKVVYYRPVDISLCSLFYKIFYGRNLLKASSPQSIVVVTITRGSITVLLTSCLTGLESVV